MEKENNQKLSLVKGPEQGTCVPLWIQTCLFIQRAQGGQAAYSQESLRCPLLGIITGNIKSVPPIQHL